MYEPIAAQSDALAGGRLRPGPGPGRVEAAGHGGLAGGQSVEVDPDPVVGLVDLGPSGR